VADLAILVAWLQQAIEDLPSDQAKIVLNINGCVVDADVVTVARKVDAQGRLVKVEQSARSHLRIGRKKSR
jgi:hypothetical protein